MSFHQQEQSIRMKMKALFGCGVAAAAAAASMNRQKIYIVVIFIQFVYVGMSLLSKAAITEGMKYSVFVFYRQAFAALSLAPFAVFLERQKSAPPLSFFLLCKIFLVSLCGITLSLNLYYFGLNYVSATFATAFTNTLPAITFILAVCLRFENVSIKQRHGMAKVIGSAVGVCGALVFTFIKGTPMYPAAEKETPGHSTKTYSKQEWIKGSVMMLFANITWALWLIMQAPLIKEYPSKLRLTALQCFFCGIQSFLFAIAVNKDISSFKLGWNLNLLSVVYCGVVVTGITYWLQVWTVEKKGPVFTALFSPLALIMTAILSAILFKETLHWGSFAGAILLVGGLYGVLWGKSEEVKSERNEEESESKQEVQLESITTPPTT